MFKNMLLIPVTALSFNIYCMEVDPLKSTPKWITDAAKILGENKQKSTLKCTKNPQNKANQTLWRAVENNNIEKAKKLIANGANVNYQNENGSTLIYLAVTENNKEMTDLLINSGANIYTRNKPGFSPFDVAINSEARTDIVKLLLDKAASYGAKALESIINTPTEFGRIPLHQAVMHGGKEIVELLIKAGSNINTQDKQGETPLHKASLFGKKDVAQLLLDNGASKAIKNQNGQTAEDYAQEQEDIKELFDNYIPIVTR